MTYIEREVDEFIKEYGYTEANSLREELLQLVTTVATAAIMDSSIGDEVLSQTKVKG